MGRLALPLIACVLLGGASCGPPTPAAAPHATASSTAAPHTAASSSFGPESTAAPPHPEPTTAAETSDASAALQRDATLDQVIDALDGLCQSSGRATAAGPFAALTNALAGVQTMLAAVSGRLDGVHASQLELRELHNSLEERLGAFQTEVSSRLSESQNEVSSRLAESQTEVSSRLDAVQTGLSEDRDGLRHWQTETDNMLTSMHQRLTNLTGELGDWRTSVESTQTALPERVAAVLQRLPTCSSQPDQSTVQTQLEDILAAVGRIPKTVLGEACTRDTDCSRRLPEATCSASGVCTCRDGYRQVSPLQCRQYSRLDEVCLEDADCQTSNRNCSCKSTVAGYEYRLVGGPSCSEGNVELRRTGGSWGLVCDDEWSTFDANVLCRSLGFSSGQATGGSRYGWGTNFLMDDVECTGSEEHLVLCPYNGWGRHDCGAYEVAGVRCQN